MQVTDAPFNFPIVQPATVRKRDGQTTQPFDVGKIESAVRKAWLDAEGQVDDEGLQRVAAFVAATLRSNVANVEEIQDAVEVALMRAKKYAVAKAYILYRHERTEARAVRQTPDPSAVMDYVHASKYGKFRPELSRREVYEETVARVEDMHLRRFAHIPEMPPLIKRAFDLVRQKKVLPSMRSMQFGGAAIESNHNRGYNCSASLIDRPRVFAEAMFLLLSGCGVGYSVQFDHVDKLPALAHIDTKKVVHHVIADTIEGWANAVDALVAGYVAGYHVEFAYHLIRGAGTPLKTSGGRAPGHQKLKLALERVRGVLHGAQGRKMRPIEAHRAICHIADAVLSGGIRRSACICLFSFEDSEMMYAKADASWFDKEPWLANANNSVVLKRDDVKEKQFKRIFGMTKNYGEPGVLFVNDYNHVTNPCQPGWATVLTPDGIRTFDDIDVGSTIWSGLRWTKVSNKVMTGVKPVFGYHTQAGIFFGTDNHRVMVHGKRVEVRDAKSIDRAPYPNQDGRTTHSIECRTSMGDHPVYDITVEAEEHTYWTGGLLVSNCSEINLQPVLEHADGTTSTGWSLCNLCEINAAKLTSFEDFSEAAWAATLIGTIQATYTDMPFLGKVTEAIVRRDALLGVGMTGMQDSPQIAANPSYQRAIAERVVDWNKTYAALLGINQAARTTCVKPSGTTSLELGNVGSGIHPHHARRYIRRVTADELEVVFQAFKAANPTMCVRKPDGKWVIEFPVEAPGGAVLKEDLSAQDFMDIVRSTQLNWVKPGTTRGDAHHNVSNTITVRSDEWASTAAYLWKHREDFTGVSLLGDDGDQVFAFAPFEAVKTEAQERRWNELVASYVPLDYMSVFEAEDGTSFSQESACSGGSCSIV